ncbi:wsv434 [White spot syndrome virus]|uniref:Wsv434 n=5 Tax=White spot syndrome virus TaxID=342409 RepID=Q8VAI0_WSSVS|nr:wsv434 [Shrimp white spot syndrome virus]AFX59811.1 wsv434 [White spot syndrome virus]AAL33436.1 wsv434 [Shrimp white spot syndrome virus]AAL89361.1 WSSV493 [Shrimp white spot syndrome virus]AWQ61411.1 wsv434 [Shrimp white spot syndrome virus]AWQ61859.1 wsv434 [Shrimp white spot syndrome virus]
MSLFSLTVLFSPLLKLFSSKFLVAPLISSTVEDEDGALGSFFTTSLLTNLFFSLPLTHISAPTHLVLSCLENNWTAICSIRFSWSLKNFNDSFSLYTKEHLFFISSSFTASSISLLLATCFTCAPIIAVGTEGVIEHFKTWK